MPRDDVNVTKLFDQCAMYVNIYPERPINSFDIQYPLFNIQYISDIPQRPIWSGRHSTLILLSRGTHSRSSTNITSTILPVPQRERRDCFVRDPKNTAPNVASLTERAHESWAHSSKCWADLHQLHMLRLLVFPNLARHQQCSLTLVAGLAFCLPFWWKPVAPHWRAGHESWAQFQ